MPIWGQIVFAAKRSEAIDGIFCKDLSTNMKEKHSLAVIVCGFAKWNSRKAFFYFSSKSIQEVQWKTVVL